MAKRNSGKLPFDERDGDLLIARYNDGSATTAERALVESWYMHGKFKGELVKAEQVLLDQLTSREKLIKHMKSNTSPRRPVLFWNGFVRSRVAILAASIVLMISIVYFLKPFQKNGSNTQIASFGGDIPPGRVGATLLFSDGKKIELQGTKGGANIGPRSLTYEDGTSVGYGYSAHQQVTASTARGFTAALTLADGTRVWLNAASMITSPVSFKGLANRRISMVGEAYFEVAKDAKHPFIVECSGQSIEVLGTHFNINSYQGQESIKTTLIEGRVKVSAMHSTMAYAVLSPGQQAVFNGTDPIEVKEVDVNEAMDWKNGDFIFNKESLGDMMKRVERWYNVEVVYLPGVNIDQTFGGKVSRSKNISAVLSSLQSTGKVTFKIEGRQVIVSAK